MFICSICQKEYNKWLGQCENCKSWNSLVESEVTNIKSVARSRTKADKPTKVTPINISDIETHPNYKKGSALTTGIGEFDNAIGGQFVKGQVILLGGAPGIGKSTLSLQIIESLSKSGKKIVYVCGEESPEQIKHRAERLKLKLTNISFIPETNIRSIEQHIASKHKEIDFLVVDSIQTVYEPNVSSTTGSVSQISECTNIITSLSKGYSITTLIIGHITKSGDIAGPMILEHMVDTVLLFEGDKRGEVRVLRVEKNRFGPTDEVGLFKMGTNGLAEVKDTKELFESHTNNASGAVYSVVMEGTRPIIIEVQALATKSYFANPRRTTSGFDLNRLFILLAIIEKKIGINTGEYDVYVNITGGVKINDPALDLAVVKAIVSSIKDKIVSNKELYFGEIGLTGEIRKVFMEEKRLKESKRIGFDKIYYAGNVKTVREIL